MAKLDVCLIGVGSCETVTCVSNTRFRLGYGTHRSISWLAKTEPSTGPIFPGKSYPNSLRISRSSLRHILRNTGTSGYVKLEDILVFKIEEVILGEYIAPCCVPEC